MLFSAGLAGFLIIGCKKLQNSEKFLNFGNCFAAGIFLLVGVVHLLEESQESFNEALEEELPLGYIVALSGYALILMIEHVLLGGHDHSMKKTQDMVIRDDKMNDIEEIRGQTPLNGDFPKRNVDHISGSSNVIENTKVGRSTDKMPGLILTSALVIHSILEGIAAGIIKNEENLVILCVAILIHNIPAAFSLGIKISDLRNIWRIPLMLAFVSSSPIGIAVGIGLSHLDYPIIQAIFLGLSAGTFIYIGCTEILPEQFHDKKHKWLKFSGFLAGFAPLAILTCFVHEPHDH